MKVLLTGATGFLGQNLEPVLSEDYEKLGFVDGENCMMYKGIDELCNKIEACQLDLDMVSSITESGVELVKSHTYDERAQRLINIYEEMR